MAITAAQVKDLRERTGSGMMECKKALVDANGDMDTAAEALRKAGMAKADKKAGRVAAEGLVVIETGDDRKTAAIVEVNCETDFVAKKEDFQDYAAAIARRVLADMVRMKRARCTRISESSAVAGSPYRYASSKVKATMPCSSWASAGMGVPRQG